MPTYPFDPTGVAPSNKVTGEQQLLSAANFDDFHFVIPNFAPYFAEGLSISYRSLTNEVRTLVEGIDYYCTHWFIAASKGAAKPVYGSISFLDLGLVGTLTLQYQTLGGDWTISPTKIQTILADRLHNPPVTAWDMVADLPYAFPPIDHEHSVVDLIGMSDVVTALGAIETAILQGQTSSMTAHLAAVNPHNVTPAGIGAYSRNEVDALLSNSGNAAVTKFLTKY